MSTLAEQIQELQRRLEQINESEAAPAPAPAPAAAPAADPNQIPTIDAPSFSQAYAQAKKQGLKKFKWCGTYAVKDLVRTQPAQRPPVNVPPRRQFGGLNPNVELGPQSGSDLPIAP